ncbi:MAG: integrin alpha, partial [Myxococcota bacterium]
MALALSWPGDRALFPLKQEALLSIPAEAVEIRAVEGGFSLRSSQVQVFLGTNGLEVGGWRFDFGDGGEAPTVEGHRVQYRRAGGIVEWYQANAHGVEQGFEVPRRPQGDLVLSAQVEGPGAVTRLEDGLAFGQLRYTHLAAYDARGRRLHARMEWDDSSRKLALRLDGEELARADFPVTIDPLLSTASWTVDPTDQAGANFGYSVASAGDINGDGYADVVVGAFGEGRAYLYLGSAAGLSATPAWTAADPTNQTASFGYSVAGAGDVNGDGYGDVVVGAPLWDGTQAGNEGRAYLFLGTAAGLSSSPAWTADPTDQAGAEFGHSVAGAGDVNGDGYGDVVVGAELWDGQAVNEGRVYLYLGSATGLSSTPVWTADPTDQANAGQDIAVARAGDVNADGYGDLLLGAPSWSGQEAIEGRAYLYLGSASGLSSVPDWTVDPTDQINAYFGYSIAGVGDVNGDDYGDVVVGAFGWNGQATLEGRAYLYLGSAAGLSMTPTWTADPTDQISAYFGSSIAGAGDVNGDGFADVVVGASNLDDPEANEGSAFLYLGSAIGLASTPTWSATPTNQPNAFFGNSLAGAGDVNGDGFGDVVVGAFRWSGQGTNEGRAYAYLGSATGLSSTPTWAADPADQISAEFGFSVASAGDVNGDGYSDVVVGAPLWDGTQAGDEGRVYLFLGSAIGLSTTPTWTADPTDQAGAEFGHSVASAGDVNGDGYADVVVGAHGWGGPNGEEGRAYLFLGSPTGLSSTPAWTADPTDQAFSVFGGAVAGAGDVNGDGYADVVVAAHDWDGEQINEGRVYLFLGSAAGLSPTPAWTADPTDQNAAHFGFFALAGVGDVNGDGYADVGVGAHNWRDQATTEGRAYVFLGNATGLSATPSWTADPTNQAGAQFGVSIAAAGDVNGDGFGDVVVGAYFWDGQASREGRAYLYLGGASGLSSTPAWTADPTDQVDAFFGVFVAGAGDVNADGFGDVVVGAHLWDSQATNEGQAYVYLGNPSGLSPTPAWTADPTDQTSSGFGVSVAGAGDVNGDGFADVLIGANGWNGSMADEGRAYLYLGGDSDLPGLDRGLRQFQADGVTHLGVGGNVNGNSFVAQGLAPQAWSVGGRLRLEVEPKRVGAAFDGTGTARSTPVIGGQLASVTVSGLVPDAGYRWRARVVDPVSTQYGRWVSFGGNSEAEPDFFTRGISAAVDGGTPPDGGTANDGGSEVDGGTTADGGALTPLHLRVGCGCSA